MAAAVNPLPLPVSVEEYLRSVYDPDVDYVDGVLEERNVGEWDHAWLQRTLLFALAAQEKQFGYVVIQELRVQVAQTRFRVPDIALLRADRLPKRIATDPPLLCIEVLSPEDRVSRIRVKCQDYLRMGVPEAWMIDGERKTVRVLRNGSETEISEGVLRVPEIGIQLGLAEIFMPR